VGHGLVPHLRLSGPLGGLGQDLLASLFYVGAELRISGRQILWLVLRIVLQNMHHNQLRMLGSRQTDGGLYGVL
jgi:hypothetical protein